MRQKLKCIRYVLSLFSQRLAGNTFIIGTDQTGLYGLGFEPTEEKRVKIYSGKKKKSQSSQMQVVVWRKSLSFFFPFLYSRGTEMTAGGRSGSTKVQWRRRTGMHIKDSRLECVHLSFSLSLSLSLSFTLMQTCTHLSQTLIRQTNGRFLICVTIHADGPLFARGSLELLPFE